MDQKDINEFNQVVEELRKQKINANIKWDKIDGINIELGWNYPDRYADKVFEIIEGLGIKNYCICAISDGSDILMRKTSMGGAKVRWN